VYTVKLWRRPEEIQRLPVDAFCISAKLNIRYISFFSRPARFGSTTPSRLLPPKLSDSCVALAVAAMFGMALVQGNSVIKDPVVLFDKASL
jgi:energy-coupling factor transporter transmembrane protein EcfT